jgi:PPP family 3-phenylpropionic acid transporter
MKVGRPAWLPKVSMALMDERAVLCLLYFAYYGSAGAWFPFFSVYLQQIGLSGLQIGTLAGIRPAVIVLSQPLWGVVADLWGRRRTLLLTTLLAAFGVLGFSWGKDFWFLSSWSVLYALLSNPVGSLIDSLALDYLERENGLFYGRLRLWGAIGWAVAAYAAGRAIASRDMRLIFVFAAVLMLPGWPLALRTSRQTAGIVGALGSNWRGLGPLLRNRRLLAFLVLVTLLQVGASPIFTFFSVYMNELGASRQLIGLAFGIQGLSELPVYLIAAAIIRHVGLTRTLVLAFLLMAARSLLYSFIAQPALAVASQLLHGSFSLFLVASIEYVNRLVPSAWRATGQSLFGAAHMGAGAILGNMLAGFLYDQMGVQGMYRWSGILILAVALAAGLVLRGNHDPRIAGATARAH